MCTVFIFFSFSFFFYCTAVFLYFLFYASVGFEAGPQVLLSVLSARSTQSSCRCVVLNFAHRSLPLFHQRDCVSYLLKRNRWRQNTVNSPTITSPGLKWNTACSSCTVLLLKSDILAKQKFYTSFFAILEANNMEIKMNGNDDMKLIMHQEHTPRIE